ncbi:hypothetical protein PMAYCL1PPCAC_00406, partial [Pristionchus mayeri]
TIYFQIGMPFWIQAVPISIFCCAIIMSWFSPGPLNVLQCIQHTHGVFNSIFLIATTPSYRRAVVRSVFPERKSVTLPVLSTINT